MVQRTKLFFTVIFIIFQVKRLTVAIEIEKTQKQTVFIKINLLNLQELNTKVESHSAEEEDSDSDDDIGPMKVLKATKEEEETKISKNCVMK